jgi:LysR family hydrogen peroxide-inducible transcriptional activator
VELESFSQAAAQCHISQPALSEQIQKLEARVSTTLLNRNHRRIVPTEAGLILVKRAKTILEQIEEAKYEVRSCDGTNAGKVSVGILPTIAPYFLAHILDDFIKQSPKIQVHIHENTTDHSLHLIETGKLDMGIISLPVRDNGFHAEKLFSEEMLLAVHAHNPVARKRTVLTDDLRSEKFILMQEDHCLGKQVVGFCNRHDFQPQIVLRCGQLATVQSLVGAGMGISLIPQMAITEKPTDVIYRQLEHPRPKRSIAIVTRNKRPLKLAAQQFLKHVRLAGKAFKLPVLNQQQLPQSQKSKA